MLATFFHAIGPPNGRTPAWLAGPNARFSLPAPRWSRRTLSLPNGQHLPGEGSLDLDEVCGSFSTCNGNSSSSRKSSLLAPIPFPKQHRASPHPRQLGFGRRGPYAMCSFSLLGMLVHTLVQALAPQSMIQTLCLPLGQASPSFPPIWLWDSLPSLLIPGCSIS